MPVKVREWTLTDEIGRGGMGVVYRATHEILTGAWAVKVIRPELSEDKESRLRFLQEASTLARMQHPNIVSIQTPFQEGGQIYLPMEFLNGQSLEQILKADGSAWSAECAVNVIRQAAAGLGYAHRQSPAVLHRDIKPGNIQVLDDGRVKVLDFGLARTLGDKSMTGTGKAVGTPAYMAPEVLDGRKATERSDVYSLGVVLYRLLAGRLPFDMPEEDSSIQATFVAVIRGLERGLPDVRDFAPLTPPALADLTMQTLSRASEGRPVDGAELAGLLGKIDTRPVLPKLHQKADYSTDSTCLGIDLNSAIVKKPVVVDGSGTERKSSASDIVKSVPKQEDADRSLIGLDLRDVGVQLTEKPVCSVPVPVNTKCQVDSVKAVAEPTRVRMEEPPRTRTSRQGALVLTIIVLSALAIGAALAGWWLFYEEPHRALEKAQVSEVPVAQNAELVPERNKAVPQQAAEAAGLLLSVEWVRIAGGSFSMGSNGSVAFRRETPVHQVTVQTFEMAKTEVTVAQYRKCVEADVCTGPNTGDKCNWGVSGREEHPINCVDWDQASAYAKWVGGRLPTEAEWEYAARSGGLNRKYPWGNQRATCRYAVMDGDDGEDGCGLESTWPVCSKVAGNTEQNLCDMTGNVEEWVQDSPHNSYKGAPSNGSAWESPSDSTRVIRGGSSGGGANFLRTTHRFSYPSGSHIYSVGLRPVRSVR